MRKIKNIFFDIKLFFYTQFLYNYTCASKFYYSFICSVCWYRNILGFTDEDNKYLRIKWYYERTSRTKHGSYVQYIDIIVHFIQVYCLPKC